MARITINAVYDIETMTLVAHDGQYETDFIPIRCDRGAVAQAKKQGQQAGDLGTSSGSSAAVDRSAVIPGIINDAQHPVGLGATTKNNMLVSNQEAVGGATGGVTGEANLAAARTRNAGGFTAALGEANREKGRQLAGGARDVETQDALLKQQQQQQARNQLLGLYGTDTSHQLQAMGLQGEDLARQLEAGRQGWYQNTLQGLNTAANLGGAAAGMKKAGYFG